MQHGGSQGGRGGFAAGAGYGQHRLVIKVAPCQFHFGQNFRNLRVHQPCKPGYRHAGAGHHKGRACKLRGGMLAKLHVNAKGCKLGGKHFPSGQRLEVAVQ